MPAPRNPHLTYGPPLHVRLQRLKFDLSVYDPEPENVQASAEVVQYLRRFAKAPRTQPPLSGDPPATT